MSHRDSSFLVSTTYALIEKVGYCASMCYYALSCTCIVLGEQFMLNIQNITCDREMR